MAEEKTELDEAGILALTAAGDRELREPGTELTLDQGATVKVAPLPFA